METLICIKTKDPTYYNDHIKDGDVYVAVESEVNKDTREALGKIILNALIEKPYGKPN